MESLRLDEEYCNHKIHVVAVPYPAQGHIVPFMQLCKRLGALEEFTITFVNTEHNHARLLQSQSAALQASSHEFVNSPGELLDIRLVGIPGGLPPELHGNPSYVAAAFQASEALQEPFEKLLEKLNEEGPPVTYIISDVLMSWTQDSADKLGVPRIAFWTSSASVYHVIWHMYGLISQGIPTLKAINTTFQDDDTEMVSCIPGLPTMDLNDLPIIVRSGPADFIYQFLLRQLKPMERAASVLFNTFYELEHQCLAALQGPVPIHIIGPLLPAAIMGTAASKEDSSMGGGIFNEDASCLDWLDSRPPRSVLYISFGSIVAMSWDQFTELTAGLEASEQAFLWAIRPDFVEGGYVDKLPPSFLSSTKHRGILVSWVPQLQVLSHPSVGGFLTHCGWNSTLESVTLGVPMLCWPDVGERRTNGRLAVSLWKAGMEFKRSKVDGSVGRKEVERIIRLLMESTPVAMDMRVKAAALQEAAQQAIKEGGSSARAWETFLNDMKRQRPPLLAASEKSATLML